MDLRELKELCNSSMFIEVVGSILNRIPPSKSSHPDEPSPLVSISDQMAYDIMCNAIDVCQTLARAIKRRFNENPEM